MPPKNGAIAMTLASVYAAEEAGRITDREARILVLCVDATEKFWNREDVVKLAARLFWRVADRLGPGAAASPKTWPTTNFTPGGLIDLEGPWAPRESGGFCVVHREPQRSSQGG